MKPRAIIAAIVIVGTLLLVAGGLYYWRHQKDVAAKNAPTLGEPPQSVQVVAARIQSWQPTAQLAGTVIALQSVTLSSEVPGTVKEVKFESGSVVEAGQVLLVLDAATEEAQLRSEEASVKVAEADADVADADVRLAEANIGRITQAAEARASSQAELDSAKSALDAARARRARAAASLEQSRAQADELRSMIAKKTLRAPFKATAGLRNIYPGQYLAAGSPVVGLQAVADRIYLDFALPQELATLARPGMKVMATAPMLGKDPIPIEVVALDATADPTTRNVRVRSIVPNTNQSLRPGMFVDVVAPYAPAQERVVVPAQAVRRATFGDHVFVIAPDEKDPGQFRAVQRIVKTGAMIDGDLVILEGLKAGEQVAANGSFKLHPNAPVIKTDAPPAPGSASANK
ncbi:MAG: efflux RND transporter periplasmic adaptor subunit [Phycisphaerales bacterium]|nr:efflux RND transporter periplasmic adaptor subunit [Phycisphaerales bacterium]